MIVSRKIEDTHPHQDSASVKVDPYFFTVHPPEDEN
jgi:hypothetical protein